MVDTATHQIFNPITIRKYVAYPAASMCAVEIAPALATSAHTLVLLSQGVSHVNSG